EPEKETEDHGFPRHKKKMENEKMDSLIVDQKHNQPNSTKLHRLDAINIHTSSSSTKLNKLDCFHHLEKVVTMRTFWEEKASEPESIQEGD
ncbi:hypothetical protein NDU88_004743, partial [Pleurodeles waltl]